MDALVLVDALDSHGMMLSRQRLGVAPGQQLVIGRELACDVVLSDPYVAPRHAALSFGEDGSLRIDDLGTVNGLIVADKRVRSATLVGPGAQHVQVGRTHLRVRSAGPLDPERRDRESLRSKYLEYGVAVAGILLCAGFAGFMAWVRSPDHSLPLASLRLALPGAGVLAAWFALWALLGRAVRSRWQWSSSAAITLGAAAASLWLWWGTDVAVFASGSSQLEIYGAGLLLLVAGVAIFLHLRAATRLRSKTAAVAASLIPLLACLGWLWLQGQQDGEDVNRLPSPAPTFPPTWSRQPGMRLDRFLDEGLDLRFAADQRGHAVARD